MKKRIMYIIIFIYLMILQTGCSKERYKKVVIEEDVNRGSYELIELMATGQIHLELKKGDYFYPLFYDMGEVYGYIGRSQGPSDIGDHRQYLYKIDKGNKLAETSREYLNSLPNTQAIGFEKNIALIIDYKKDSIPMIIPELTYEIIKLKENNKKKSYNIDMVSGNDNFIIISEGSYDNRGNDKRKVYLYNIKDKKFYRPGNDIMDGEICYVDILESLIWMDQQDFKIYKVVLEEGSFILEEYIDVGIEDKASRVRAVMKNGNEMVILQDRIVSKEGSYRNSHLYETNLVTKFDFSTNQYDYVFRKPTVNNIYIEYMGHDMLLVEEFDLVDDKYIVPTTRSLYRMVGRVVNLIYQEKLKEVSEQFYPTNRIVISENGKEIFSAREIINIEKGKIVTKDVIYQRINISKKDLGDNNE